MSTIAHKLENFIRCLVLLVINGVVDEFLLTESEMLWKVHKIVLHLIIPLAMVASSLTQVEGRRKSSGSEEHSPPVNSFGTMSDWFDSRFLEAQEFWKHQINKGTYHKNKGWRHGKRAKSSEEEKSKSSSDSNEKVDSTTKAPIESRNEKAFKSFIKMHQCQDNEVYKTFLYYYKKAVDNLKARNSNVSYETPWLLKMAQSETCSGPCKPNTREASGTRNSTILDSPSSPSHQGEGDGKSKTATDDTDPNSQSSVKPLTPIEPVPVSARPPESHGESSHPDTKLKPKKKVHRSSKPRSTLAPVTTTEAPEEEHEDLESQTEKEEHSLGGRSMGKGQPKGFKNTKVEDVDNQRNHKVEPLVKQNMRSLVSDDDYDS